MRLTVTRTFAVAELGTVAFLAEESVELPFGSRHRVMVTQPDGKAVEANASVECIRNDSSGTEFAALLFESLALHEVVVGASVVVLGEVPGA
jgi:hypothetical protein